ncbi:MAG: alanine racemase [Salibacteraceae bacterium]|nr:alanine racemase [Salibacteraceae bacterium]|tara:strand:- start:6159 stop:7313 length:1155 start_codon:yes stop_codon:yes gene_type:complete
MFQTSYIELSESAVKNNIDFIHNFIGEGVTFSSVVKGNAYGHGIANYCPIAYKYGVRHFSVFSAQEAFNVSATLPNHEQAVMIMGQIENEELEWAIEHNIEFYVFEIDRLEHAIAVAKKMNKKALIHVELETGMNRTGFPQKGLPEVLKSIENNLQYLEVKGICTHLAGAESIANYKRIKDQLNRFKRYQLKLKDTPWNTAKKHISSSSATLRYTNSQLDMVRIGILQFGFFPTEEIFVHYCAKKKTSIDPMQRILSWKARVMDTKTVKAGEFIGYGTSYLTNQTSKIALIPIGYSFGYSRSLSNQGKVLINGGRFDVVGTVNMSMLAVDITSDPSIKKGDEVVLIGSQGEQELSVSSFSDFSQLINYELLTRLPQDIPRIITK